MARSCQCPVAPEDVKNQASPKRWCRDTDASDLPKANPATDSVRISRNFQARRSGLCSGALPLGPDVLAGSSGLVEPSGKKKKEKKKKKKKKMEKKKKKTEKKEKTKKKKKKKKKKKEQEKEDKKRPAQRGPVEDWEDTRRRERRAKAMKSQTSGGWVPEGAEKLQEAWEEEEWEREEEEDLERLREELAASREPSVADITGHSARVYWSINQVTEEARKIHLELLLDQGGGGMSEVAFFEVGGSQSSWELPDGTLQKGCGPYQVQLVVESGPEEAPRLTAPSRSELFWAAEAPSQARPWRVTRTGQGPGDLHSGV
eukprot:Skav202509  [mRNA]  locus=scaffold1359:74321:91836:- [translate_table: standard]